MDNRRGKNNAVKIPNNNIGEADVYIDETIGIAPGLI